MEVEFGQIKETNKHQLRQIRDLKGDLRRYKYEVEVFSHAQNGNVDILVERQQNDKTRFEYDDNDRSVSRNN